MSSYAEHGRSSCQHSVKSEEFPASTHTRFPEGKRPWRLLQNYAHLNDSKNPSSELGRCSFQQSAAHLLLAHFSGKTSEADLSTSQHPLRRRFPTTNCQSGLASWDFARSC
eukprot:6340003-Amphidinium_carterae.1